MRETPFDSSNYFVVRPIELTYQLAWLITSLHSSNRHSLNGMFSITLQSVD